jgi:hypothetical protein
VLETKKACAAAISSAYGEMFDEEKEISEAAVKQLLADTAFLALALGEESFQGLRNRLLGKLMDIDGLMDRLTSHLKTYWKRTSLLFGILNVEDDA